MREENFDSVLDSYTFKLTQSEADELLEREQILFTETCPKSSLKSNKNWSIMSDSIDEIDSKSVRAVSYESQYGTSNVSTEISRIIKYHEAGQIEAQLIFRDLTICSTFLPTNNRIVGPTQSKNTHHPTHLVDRLNGLPTRIGSRKIGSGSLNPNSESRHLDFMGIPDISSIESQARQDRLKSLGIFDLTARVKLSPSKDTANTVKPLVSFSTPTHQKATKLKEIVSITSPRLISSSCNVLTVPIEEILNDLAAAGRLRDTGHDEDLLKTSLKLTRTDSNSSSFSDHVRGFFNKHC